MPPRIVFLLDQLNLAGAQKRAVSIARGLDPNRFEVEIICLNGEGPLKPEIEAAGINLRILAFDPSPKRIRNIGEFVRLVRILRRSSPHIVHTFSYWSTIYGSIAARIARVPAIITSRTSLYDLKPQGRIPRLLERLINPLATSIVTISEAVREDTIKIEGVPADRVELIYSGTNVESPSAEYAPEKLRDALGVGSNDRVVIMVANLHVYKRHDTLLEAARVVLERHPDVKFLMVGRDTQNRRRLEKLASQWGVRDAIKWTGVRRDVPDLLGISSVGVLCSETEALGNSVLEYMGAGLPVVATRVGGLREIIVEGETGYLVDVGDARSLAARLIELLDDPERAQQLGSAGRERVKRVFSRAKMIEGYDALYRRWAPL